MNITIRSATSADIPTIADFNCCLAQETEDLKLDPDTVVNGVTQGLKLAPEVRYFVGETDGQVVGQLMLTREWSDWRDGWMYWLQSVYVAADYRGQGMFRQLLDHVTQSLTQQNDVACLRLYVEEDNTAAIETYTRLKFKDSGYRVMEMPLR